MAYIPVPAIDSTGTNEPLAMNMENEAGTIAADTPVFESNQMKPAPDLNDLFPTGGLSQGYAI
jgi:hypothetical protein